MVTGVHLDTLAEVLRDAHHGGLNLTGVELTPANVPHTHGEGARRIGPGGETSWTAHVESQSAKQAQRKKMTDHRHHEHWKVLSPMTRHRLHHRLNHTTALCTPYDKLRIDHALKYLFPDEGLGLVR